MIPQLPNRLFLLGSKNHWLTITQHMIVIKELDKINMKIIDKIMGREMGLK